jgi:hypothetical protein
MFQKYPPASFFFIFFFFETLHQDYNPTLQLVAKVNQGRTLIVLFCHGTRNWIIQENWGILVYPEMKGKHS